ncbi:MAG: nuclear transport factor 2 family protein [Mycobacteriaceae bacterium]|nr:nuclear transport factor 2 family protein [Mycobacteriaceae bacterium]
MRLLAILAVTASLAALGTVGSFAPAHADTCVNAWSAAPLATDTGTCADVLAQEGRWLTAITAGDRSTIDSILGANFKHIDSHGALFDRAQELDGVVAQPFVMNPADQIVDIAGPTAVVHGVNTLTQAGTVLARERFTDVFLIKDGTWTALSAQETAM